MTTPTSPEPVAWRWRLPVPDSEWHCWTTRHPNWSGELIVEPLYAAAPAPPEELELETSDEDRAEWQKRTDDAGRLARDVERLMDQFGKDYKTALIPEPVARRATLEEALAAVQKQRDTAAGHDGEAYLAGTYNGLDQACEIIRALAGGADE